MGGEKHEIQELVLMWVSVEQRTARRGRDECRVWVQVVRERTPPQKFPLN